jgi:hypothetical protein
MVLKLILPNYAVKVWTKKTIEDTAAMRNFEVNPDKRNLILI